MKKIERQRSGSLISMITDNYQLIKTMTTFERETRHPLEVSIKKKTVNLAKCETTVCPHDVFCPPTQA